MATRAAPMIFNVEVGCIYLDWRQLLEAASIVAKRRRKQDLSLPGAEATLVAKVKVVSSSGAVGRDSTVFQSDYLPVALGEINGEQVLRIGPCPDSAFERAVAIDPFLPLGAVPVEQESDGVRVRLFVTATSSPQRKESTGAFGKIKPNYIEILGLNGRIHYRHLLEVVGEEGRGRPSTSLPSEIGLCALRFDKPIKGKGGAEVGYVEGAVGCGVDEAQRERAMARDVQRCLDSKRSFADTAREIISKKRAAFAERFNRPGRYVDPTPRETSPSRPHDPLPVPPVYAGTTMRERFSTAVSLPSLSAVEELLSRAPPFALLRRTILIEVVEGRGAATSDGGELDVAKAAEGDLSNASLVMRCSAASVTSICSLWLRAVCAALSQTRADGNSAATALSMTDIFVCCRTDVWLTLCCSSLADGALSQGGLGAATPRFSPMIHVFRIVGSMSSASSPDDSSSAHEFGLKLTNGDFSTDEIAVSAIKSQEFDRRRAWREVAIGRVRVISSAPPSGGSLGGGSASLLDDNTASILFCKCVLVTSLNDQGRIPVSYVRDKKKRGGSDASNPPSSTQAKLPSSKNEESLSKPTLQIAVTRYPIVQLPFPKSSDPNPPLRLWTSRNPGGVSLSPPTRLPALLQSSVYGKEVSRVSCLTEGSPVTLLIDERPIMVPPTTEAIIVDDDFCSLCFAV